jgi:tripartite-type tricarboxylate transporter receptor subunit TctC
MTMLRRTLLALPIALGAHAQTFPTQPVNIVIPFSPGGPTDAVARLLAESLTRELGQNVVTENVTGAGGTLGVTRVAQARPDGYNLLLHNIGMATAPSLYRRLPFDPLNSFEFLGLITPVPMVWIGKPEGPADFAGLIADFRARTTAVNLAHAGLGSASQLCATLFQAALGVNATMIPFRGSGPVFPELMAGRIDYYCDQTTSAIPQIQGGRIRGYAVATAQPLPQLPNIPTAGSAGLPGFEISIWHGLYAPRGTPAPVTQRVNAALRAAMADPRVVARLNELGTAPEPADRITPGAHRAHVAAEIERWRPILSRLDQYLD